MIKSIRLQNWKSFADATLRVQPLTVLVGTNASGKSNLFEAFSFLKRFVSGVPIGSLFDNKSDSFVIRGGKEWAIRKGQKTALIEILLEHTAIANGELLYRVSFDYTEKNGLRLFSEKLYEQIVGGAFSSIFEAQRNELNFFEIDHKNHHQGVSGKVSTDGCVLHLLNKVKIPSENIYSEVLSTFTDIHFIHPVPSFMRGYSLIGKNLNSDGSNTAGVLVAAEKAGIISVAEGLNKYIHLLPDFDLQKVYAEAIKPLEKDAMLFGVEKLNPDDKKGFLVDAQTMSDGTLHFIGILTALMTVPENSLLIMEEINQGLHPSRAKDLVDIIMEIIQERKIDVMFSTHDPALLDAVGLRFSENIQVVYRNEKGESGIKTLRDFSGFAKLMGRGTLGTLSTRGELTESTFQ